MRPHPIRLKCGLNLIQNNRHYGHTVNFKTLLRQQIAFHIFQNYLTMLGVLDFELLNKIEALLQRDYI